MGFFVRLLMTLVLAVACRPDPALASPVNAFQMWTPVYLDWPLLGPRMKKLRGYLECQPRLNDGLDGMNQVLVRPGVGMRFNRHVAVYGGYAWINNFQPIYRQEQRVWQDLGLGSVLFKKLQVFNRFRLEERFIQHTSNQPLVRGRYMLRLAIPIRGRWYAAAHNELFVNFNSVRNGPAGGLDQNRWSVSLGRQVNNNLRIETGYLNQYINARDPAPDRMNHILQMQAFYNL